MAYLGKRKLGEVSPNHPWANTQVGLGNQSMQTSKPESPPQKNSNFDPYRGMVEFYDKLSDEEKEELRAQGIS